MECDFVVDSQLYGRGDDEEKKMLLSCVLANVLDIHGHGPCTPTHLLYPAASLFICILSENQQSKDEESMHVVLAVKDFFISQPSDRSLYCVLLVNGICARSGGWPGGISIYPVELV